MHSHREHRSTTDEPKAGPELTACGELSNRYRTSRRPGGPSASKDKVHGAFGGIESGDGRVRHHGIWLQRLDTRLSGSLKTSPRAGDPSPLVVVETADRERSLVVMVLTTEYEINLVLIE